MNERVQALLQRIQQLEEELENEFTQAQGRFRYYVKRRRVFFEEGVAAEHLKLRKSVRDFLAGMEVRDILAGLATAAMIVPLLLLDIFLAVFQAVAFSLWDIRKVRRSDFVVIDRQHLAYLNWFEKLNCVYCSYANGLLAYAKVIAGRTEQYWCPIKHAQRVHAPHTRYVRFVDYGDAEAYRRELERLREELRERP